MFARIVHADWSKHPGGRWYASANRTPTGWLADGPWPVADVAAFVGRLVDAGRREPTLAAFDFPIGLPEAYGVGTGLPGFRAALDTFGGTGWDRWFDPAATPDEVGPRRPFYPARPGAAKVRHLLDGLSRVAGVLPRDSASPSRGDEQDGVGEPTPSCSGVATIVDLMRRTERGGPGLRSAGCMFWLVGAKTVGKAAIHGWQEAIRPALASGASLWPFDGDLAALAIRGGLVLAESYPGDAGRQLDLAVNGKNKPSVLSALAPALLQAAADRRFAFSRDLQRAVASGFSAYGAHCGDAFDAVVGLLAAIAVADGRHPDGAPDTEAVRIWEGWILGRRGAVGIPAAAGALGAGGEM